MRTIERSTIFKKDYRRESRGRYRQVVKNELITVIEKLACDKALGEQSRDHNLSGSWSGYRECHIKPDLLLIYQKPNIKILRLVRLGSHSHLFSC